MFDFDDSRDDAGWHAEIFDVSNGVPLFRIHAFTRAEIWQRAMTLCQQLETHAQAA